MIQRRKEYAGGIANCPYCGWSHFVSPVMRDFPNGEPGWAVSCSECMRDGPIAKTPRFAIRAWNEQCESMVEPRSDSESETKEPFDTVPKCNHCGRECTGITYFTLSISGHGPVYAKSTPLNRLICIECWQKMGLHGEGRGIRVKWDDEKDTE